jgi:hypothetical protein
MWISRLHKIKIIILQILFCIGILFSVNASASDGKIKIYESTFDDFIGALGQIKLTGTYSFHVWVFGCTSNYTATVINPKVTISTTEVKLTAKADTTWCGYSFPKGDLKATGNIYYSSADQTIRFSFTAASYKPKISIAGVTITLPVNIKLDTVMNIPPMKITYTIVEHETPAGTRRIYLKPKNVSLNKQTKYIEFTSDLDL